MVLENKLGIKSSVELANAEEKISKKKALQLFELGLLDKMQAGTFDSLSAIHKYLFDEIYDFAGQIRNVNIAILIICTRFINLINMIPQR